MKSRFSNPIFHVTSVGVPRRKTAVKDISKNKSRYLTSTAASVDLHFHGAFGIDLMTAAPEAMNELSERLWLEGLSAYCPTTLSATPEELADTVSRVGPWVRKKWAQRDSKKAPHGALPLGLHLEGPFIHPQSRGAHPLEAIRPIEISELEKLWDLSQSTLKILTVAPESVPDLKALTSWCKKRKIILSLGHSKATEEQAHAAFELGFSGVTHAWNAMPFHHRAPGPLGAALGRKGVHIELIVDQIHVSPTLLRWTRKLHGDEPVCYVSDCVPAAATANPTIFGDETGPWTAFGSLQIRQQDGACRLSDGSLAGGGFLLPQMICRYLEHEAQLTGIPLAKLLKEHARHWSKDPVRALNLPASLQKRALLGRLEWQLDHGHLTAKR
jgi:N-acetylglucosamine-6-phosphate deacetylase